jgi:hypothetical protein
MFFTTASIGAISSAARMHCRVFDAHLFTPHLVYLLPTQRLLSTCPQSEQKGSVPILSTSRVMHRDGSSHQFKFGLLTGKRLLEIACTSDKDRTRWTKAIQELINRVQVHTMKTGNLAPALSETATIFEDLIVKKRWEHCPACTVLLCSALSYPALPFSALLNMMCVCVCAGSTGLTWWKTPP